MRCGRLRRSSQYTGVDEGTNPPRRMLRKSLPSISAAVRASTIFTPGFSIAATTSLAVATHRGCGFAVNDAFRGGAASAVAGRCSAAHFVQPPFISATFVWPK